MRWIAIVVVSLITSTIAAPALGQDNKVHSELKRVKLREVLPGFSVETMENGAWEYTIESADSISFSGAMASTGDGTWWPVKGGGLRAKGRATGGPCMDEDDNCGRSWPWETKWDDVRMSDSGLLQFYLGVCGDFGTSKMVLECNSDQNCAPGPGPVVKVIPGSKERGLFDKTLQAVRKAKADYVGYTAVRGMPAKNPREASEIWWYDDSCLKSNDNREKASALARELEPLLGKIEPQKWTFGDLPYDIVVVVAGAEPGPAKAGTTLRIKVVDGACAGDAACKNPLYERIQRLVKEAGHQLVATGVAKKQRTATEVWHMKGHQDAARALVAKHLSKWTKPEDVKVWTWGGDFDVLVVVGEGS